MDDSVPAYLAEVYEDGLLDIEMYGRISAKTYARLHEALSGRVAAAERTWEVPSAESFRGLCGLPEPPLTANTAS